MRRLLGFIAFPVLLAACSAATSIPSSIVSHPGLALGRHAAANDNGDCEGDEVSFNGGGGKQGFPLLQGAEFYGHFQYAGTASGGSNAHFQACVGSVNQFNVPVPQGYTPDWFGNLFFSYALPPFESAKLYGDMYSTYWLPKTNYYLYLYDGSNNYITSYKMGPLKKKKEALKFASPFENGFTIPADRDLNLEIVHSTP